jgi:hypothetical protein
MIVGNLDVVGQYQRLVLGEKIKIVVDVAERPFQLAEPLLSLVICEVIAAWRCASAEAGIVVPPETTADFSAALVVWCRYDRNR